MTGASAALQAAIVRALAEDAPLGALLGGAQIFDRIPERAAFPYVTLGRAAARDWSTGTEGGAEHAVTLHAWSRGGSKGETYAILEALRLALDDRPLALAGHRLVNLRFEACDVRLEADRATFQGFVRFRAVTEPDG